jgi:hypothetical protein
MVPFLASLVPERHTTARPSDPLARSSVIAAIPLCVRCQSGVIERQTPRQPVHQGSLPRSGAPVGQDVKGALPGCDPDQDQGQPAPEVVLLLYSLSEGIDSGRCV